jgi:hypothetical protein
MGGRSVAVAAVEMAYAGLSYRTVVQDLRST